jgi:uracil-DNA glycosylase family 4
VTRPVDALLDFLRAEEARGVTHVHLDPGARSVLRDLAIRAKKPAAPPQQAAPPAPTRRAPAISLETPASPALSINHQPCPSDHPDDRLRRSQMGSLSLPPDSTINFSGDTKAARLESLRQQAETWAPARSLGTLRDTMVFATGNPDAELMLVGEAPGYHEERQREPFVGPAGQKLNDILKAMGLAREQVYISNIVKFRPAMPGQTTNNRAPSVEEMASCLPFIRAEIEIVRPKCIVALGGTAATGLLGNADAVAKLRGQWYEFDGVPLRVTYHPSYLLRTTSGNTDKRKVWEDMLEVMERLGLPISDKQRGYFLKP